jgi:hypothetical protein
MPRHLPLGWLALALALAAGALGCGGDDASASPAGAGPGGPGASSGPGQGGQGGGPASSSTGGAGGAGASGGAGGQGGQGGGPPPGCKDGFAAAGELCIVGPAKAFPSGKRGHHGLVLVDCDNDMYLDVIVPAATDDSLVALRNDTTGAFPTTVPSKTGDAPMAIAKGELDATEGIDVVTGHAGALAAGGQSLTLNIAQSTPCTFDAKPGLAVGSAVNDVTVLDINDDKVLDVAGLASATPDELVYWFNVPNNTQPNKLDAKQTSAAIAVGDVDGDKLPDVLYTDELGDLVYWRSNTKVVFGAEVPIPSAVAKIGDKPIDLAVGDLDNDGDLDVVTVNENTDGYSVALNRLAQTGKVDWEILADQPGPALATPPDTRAVALGDMDNDGYLDIVIASYNENATGQSSVAVLLNDKTGKFTLATTNNPFGVLVSESFPMAVGRHPTSVALGDVNNDGALDIITASDFVDGGTSNISVLLSQP